MSTTAKSRWADDEGDAALEAQRKQEKEERKRVKAEKQRKLEEASINRLEPVSAQQNGSNGAVNHTYNASEDTERPFKRRRLSPAVQARDTIAERPTKLLRFPAPAWGPCRHVDNFEKLNHIEEGSYGWVSRAREIATGEIVALKKLKMDNSNDGFPVTGLREIQTLMASWHPNIVNLREVVMGDTFKE